MLLGLDHLVIAVADPDSAAEQLEREVGLTCTGGGRHPKWGTFNRLAWLGDTYVELIGLFDRSLAPGGPVSRAVAEALDGGRQGLVSYAIATDDVTADAKRLRARGSDIGEPETRSRTRPDGEVVTWHAAYAELGPARPPFLVEHEFVGAEWGADARAARDSQVHPAGGTARVAGIALPVGNVIETCAEYARTVGLHLAGDSDTVHVGSQFIRLFQGRPLRDPAIVEVDVERGASGMDRLRTRDIEALGVRWRLAG